MTRRTDALIIGAGQAGLAAARCLADLSIDHVVLERGEIAQRWTSERWDSLRLLTPNWMTRLPGGGYDGTDPTGFMDKDSFAALLRKYALDTAAPVQGRTSVLSVTPAAGGYAVRTDRGDWQARTVILATGACDRPAVPGWATLLADDIRQLTTRDYRSPADIVSGGVLIVGGSATGLQLADEIARAGHPVTLATGRHVRIPRRYRGRDIMEWLDASGFLTDSRPPDAPCEHLLHQPSFQLSGGMPPRDLDIGVLAARGVRVVGRITGADGHAVRIADGLRSEAAQAETRMHRILDRIDAHIGQSGLPAPDGGRPAPVSAAALDPARMLDLRAAGIGTVLWATGFRRDYSWLRVPVLDARAEISQREGATPAAGLFVLGLPFMRRRNSAFIDGVGADARRIAGSVAQHLGLRAHRAA